MKVDAEGAKLVDASPSHGPVDVSGRVRSLDLLRGIAVLGILLMNLPAMAIAAVILDDTGSATGSHRSVDTITQYLLDVFVEGKFITIFSVLFGAGLALMSERAEAAGRRFGPIYVRRLLVLLVVGVAHGLLLWFGDILTSYALVGFAALALHRKSIATLVGMAAVFFVFGFVVWLAMIAANAQLDEATRIEASAFFPMDEVRRAMTHDELRADDVRRLGEVMSSGDFRPMFAVRAELYLLSLAMAVFFFGFRTLALFLLGVILVRADLFSSTAARRFWKPITWPALLAGVLMQSIAVWQRLDWTTAAGAALFWFGSLLTSLGYMALVIRWSPSRRGDGPRRFLEAAGRMALTNYLMQSLMVAVLVNYFGLFDRFGYFECLLLALAIFGVQILWSTPWLTRFRFGPFEWLWRSATYARLEPLHRR